jgi:hypothetical protein
MKGEGGGEGGAQEAAEGEGAAHGRPEVGRGFGEGARGGQSSVLSAWTTSDRVRSARAARGIREGGRRTSQVVSQIDVFRTSKHVQVPLGVTTHGRERVSTTGQPLCSDMGKEEKSGGSRGQTNKGLRTRQRTTWPPGRLAGRRWRRQRQRGRRKAYRRSWIERRGRERVNDRRDRPSEALSSAGGEAKMVTDGL